LELYILGKLNVIHVNFIPEQLSENTGTLGSSFNSEMNPELHNAPPPSPTPTLSSILQDSRVASPQRFFFLAVLRFELRSYTLSHSTNPPLFGDFFSFLQYWGLNSGPTLQATPPALFCDEFF
jgi:hypothetical protein